MINYTTLYGVTKDLSVLLVEDYEPLRNEMVEMLEDLFKQVIPSVNGEDALTQYAHALENKSTIDLVISDIQMSVMDGVVLSQKIRELNPTQAIIILSAHPDSKYLLELINLGISKFLTKPIMQEELFEVLYEESIRIQEQKKKITVNSIITLSNGYTWDNDLHLLKQNDKDVMLTKHELCLMQFFILKKEYVCTNEHIIDYFYGQNIDLEEKNIRNLVFKLRKKIPEKHIVNLYGLGYKFTLKR